MRRMFIAAVVAAPMCAVFACGGDGSTPDPTGPSGPPPAGTIVIDVIGERGNQSFSPNPATVPRKLLPFSRAPVRCQRERWPVRRAIRYPQTSSPSSTAASICRRTIL